MGDAGSFGRQSETEFASSEFAQSVLEDRWPRAAPGVQLPSSSAMFAITHLIHRCEEGYRPSPPLLNSPGWPIFEGRNRLVTAPAVSA